MSDMPKFENQAHRMTPEENRTDIPTGAEFQDQASPVVNERRRLSKPKALLVAALVGLSALIGIDLVNQSNQTGDKYTVGFGNVEVGSNVKFRTNPVPAAERDPNNSPQDNFLSRDQMKNLQGQSILGEFTAENPYILKAPDGHWLAIAFDVMIDEQKQRVFVDPKDPGLKTNIRTEAIDVTTEGALSATGDSVPLTQIDLLIPKS